MQQETNTSSYEAHLLLHIVSMTFFFYQYIMIYFHKMILCALFIHTFFFKRMGISNEKQKNKIYKVVIINSQ